ncbi:hypothetical protein DCC85_05625 [Paenibacillus sp. CAA11]|uniref:DUF6138 family protein n=1 Tax=Paenibacillus sp. CAA11 TaxID=1532905 RepID=UPI000D3B7F50|nr:DUF6138 family protein [Paenibacillus sp. CAA11]AWB43750.1 hypothetical protein DCC85_05625 [Paenibacillus sp. CAA11]
MNQAVADFLEDVWTEVTAIYGREKQRIDELPDRSRLQGGMMDYLRVAWRKGKLNFRSGNIAIDVHEPFSWSDSSYKLEARDYIEELSDELLIAEFFPALREKVLPVFLSDTYGDRFFDYQFELVLEFQRESSTLQHSERIVSETRLQALRQTWNEFLETKIYAPLPVIPKEQDEFFFANHLFNPDLTELRIEAIAPAIEQLSAKLQGYPERLSHWNYQYTAAMKNWAEEQFLKRYYTDTGNYSNKWELKVESERPGVYPDEMELFLYAALKIGPQEPAVREEYLQLAAELGSVKAADYLRKGSGRFEGERKSELMTARSNDVMQLIEIQIKSEEEGAYCEALLYINELLGQGFPKGYKLKLKSTVKQFLPLKKIAKSKLHQFFANALQYPGLYPLLAEYAELAMEEFAWYEDVEPSEKSVMPGTYAVFGLGLYSREYFPLVCRYMELVDNEHQSVQDGYAEAFIEAQGITEEHMPTLVSILLGASEGARPLKTVQIDTPELAEALIRSLEKKEDYERETVIYRIFGGEKKLAQAAKKAGGLLKDRLEELAQLC